MSGRPHSELASEEAFAMSQESVRQIQLKERVFFFVSLSWISSWNGSFFYLFFSGALNITIRH